MYECRERRDDVSGQDGGVLSNFLLMGYKALLSHIIRNNNRRSGFIRGNYLEFQPPIATKVAPAVTMSGHTGLMFTQSYVVQDPLYVDYFVYSFSLNGTAVGTKQVMSAYFVPH
jgi:hypothetical protein